MKHNQKISFDEIIKKMEKLNEKRNKYFLKINEIYNLNIHEIGRLMIHPYNLEIDVKVRNTLKKFLENIMSIKKIKLKIDQAQNNLKGYEKDISRNSLSFFNLLWKLEEDENKIINIKNRVYGAFLLYLSWKNTWNEIKEENLKRKKEVDDFLKEIDMAIKDDDDKKSGPFPFPSLEKINIKVKK